MAGHVHAALMAEYAEVAKTNDKPWEEFEFRMDVESLWISLNCSPNWSPLCKYRRKQRTININGFEVPEPLRVAPEIGSKFYTPYILAISQKNFWLLNAWSNCNYSYKLLADGMVHKTREAAELHAKALLSFTTTVKE